MPFVEVGVLRGPAYYPPRPFRLYPHRIYVPTPRGFLKAIPYHSPPSRPPPPSSFRFLISTSLLTVPHSSPLPPNTLPADLIRFRQSRKKRKSSSWQSSPHVVAVRPPQPQQPASVSSTSTAASTPTTPQPRCDSVTSSPNKAVTCVRPASRSTVAPARTSMKSSHRATDSSSRPRK